MQAPAFSMLSVLTVLIPECPGFWGFYTAQSDIFVVFTRTPDVNWDAPEQKLNLRTTYSTGRPHTTTDTTRHQVGFYTVIAGSSRMIYQ